MNILQPTEPGVFERLIERAADLEARALIDAVMQWPAPRRAGVVLVYSHHAHLVEALGRGEYEDAYQYAASISPPGVLLPVGEPAAWVTLDLVEAAVRTGRTAEATAHVNAMCEANVAGISTRLGLLAGAAAALAAPDEHAMRLFAEALAIPGIGRWAFDVARVQLLFGEHLRRARATTESRVHLAAALDTFCSIGARPWSNRAATELRAAGHATSRADDSDSSTLTAQELEIAKLAATGLTNKKIAARLYLSHRTVGAHLYRIFPKLGITSRAALRDALAMAS